MGWLIFWVIMAVICAMIAGSKGRSAVGFFFYGLLIWPIALVHALVMQPSETKRTERAGREIAARASAEGRRPCPFCAELVKLQATVCPHCRKDLPARWWESGVKSIPPVLRDERRKEAPD